MSEEKKRHNDTPESPPSYNDATHGQGFEAIYDDTTIDSAYLFKAQVLNNAIQEIGMGRYQWWVDAYSLKLNLTNDRIGDCSLSPALDGSRMYHKP